MIRPKNVPDSPVFDELRRQIDASEGGPIDLIAIWHAAGSPPGRGPRRWNLFWTAQDRKSIIVEDNGDQPETRVMGTIGGAWAYASSLCPKMDAAIEDALAGTDKPSRKVERRREAGQ